MKRKESTFKKFLAVALPRLISFLKGEAVKLALKKILGAAVMGGFKAWLIKFIVTELFEEVAEPVIKLGFRKLGYIHDVVEGKHILKEVEDAEDSDSWRDAAGRV